MTLSCHRAASAAAVNTTVLFRLEEDNGSLWERANRNVPLPTCSSPDAPDSRCQVCTRDEQVYAFCRNLLDRSGLVLEGTESGLSIDLEEIDCPVFPAETNFPISAIISILLILLFLFVGIGFVIYHKRCKRPNEHESVSPEEENAAAAETEINT